MERNAAQELAIRTHEGPLLLISCPGSGKTTTMLRRIYDMTESGIDPSGILMVTFTESAARDMRERFFREYGHTTVRFCTIHALAYQILRENGYSSVSVLTADQQYPLARTLIQKHAKNPYDTAVKDLLQNISAFKNKDITLGAYECTKLDPEDFQKIYPLYEAEKNAKGFIDFDDMILLCRKLLRDQPEVRARYQAMYPYLLCDEYQDTNTIQKDILYLLAGDQKNLCVVGDDDQAIYGFRGAASSIMLQFQKDFPDAHAIYMETNYRSLPTIIANARNLISHNHRRFPKKFQSFREGNGLVQVLSAPTHEAELQLLRETILSLSETTRRGEMAILTRTNAQLENIAADFEAHHIPYTVGEAVKDPYEHFIFRDLLTYLRMISGTRTREDLLRVINRPNHYVKLQALAALPSLEDRALQRMMSALYSDSPWIVSQFQTYLQKLSGLQGKSLAEQVHGILYDIDYRSYLQDYAAGTGTEAAPLLTRLQFFEQEAKCYDNAAAWYRAAKEHVARHRMCLKAHGEDGVAMMTMHQAKGLEWDCVFIPDCVMGITPSPLSKSFAEQEEERRLFYVAMTRAKNSLYLFHYGDGQQKPSPYLREMLETPEAYRARRQTQKISAKKAPPPAPENLQRYSTKRAQEKRKKSYFKESDPAAFQPGMTIHHIRFGEGEIVKVSDDTIEVNFSGTPRLFKHQLHR